MHIYEGSYVYVQSYFKYMKVYSNHTFTTPVFLSYFAAGLSVPQKCQLTQCTKCQNNISTTFTLVLSILLCLYFKKKIV